jgi:hypothetical protein
VLEEPDQFVVKFDGVGFKQPVSLSLEDIQVGSAG